METTGTWENPHLVKSNGILNISSVEIIKNLLEEYFDRYKNSLYQLTKQEQSIQIANYKATVLMYKKILESGIGQLNFMTASIHNKESDKTRFIGKDESIFYLFD